MNFDELYQKILEEKKKCNNPCLICHMSLKDNFIKLSCTHSYHPDCLFKKYSQYSIECPYCRKNGGLLPFIKGKYIKGIHISPTKVKTIKFPLL